MNPTLPRAVRPSDLTGESLYGNDFDTNELRAWAADEDQGFYKLHQQQAPGTGVADDHAALNRFHGAMLADRSYPVVLMLGPADGTDFLGLEITAERLIAIEPAREWWRSEIGGVPAEYRAPNLDGKIDLPDDSVDLVLCLQVLHHVANVGAVVAELARVLRPGGRMMVREPMVSMGDFRAPRRALTLRERGIPRALMRRFHEEAGLEIIAERPCGMAAVHMALRLIGVDAFTSAWGVRIDDAVSRLTAPIARYWRPRPWQKVAPNTMLILSRKP